MSEWPARFVIIIVPYLDVISYFPYISYNTYYYLAKNINVIFTTRVL